MSQVSKYKPRYAHSYLVECENCGLRWERIVVPTGSTYTVDNADIQYNCPQCSSNAFSYILGRTEEGCDAQPGN